MNPAGAAPDLDHGVVLPLTRRVEGAPDPVAVFDRLTDGGQSPDTLMLESAELSARSSERSLLVVRSALRVTCRGHEVEVAALSAGGQAALPWLSEQLAVCGRIESTNAVLRIAMSERPATPTDAERLTAPSCLDALRILATGWTLASRPVRAPLFIAGALSYDLIDQFEVLPPAAADPLQFPDYVFWVPEATIVIDHRRRTTQVTSLAFGGGPETVYHDAVARTRDLVSACEAASTETPGPHTAPGPEAPLTVDMDDAAYAAAVSQLKDRIVRGDVFQIVPSRTFSAPCAAPLAVYQRLRRQNPSPYMFFVNHPDWTLLGASPETCVKVTGETERTVVIRPIAGTRPRGVAPDGSADADLDCRLEAELRTSEKELAEHMMLVDLARNDVARVSAAGSRRVTRLMSVERYSHVMHLVSEVEGTLRPGLDALHAYAASLNMGTLVGAPKLRAAQLLRETEPTRRGPYGGAVGYLSCTGEMDTCIVIRSAIVSGGVARVRAGAGVVHDSDPVAEADETRRKAGAVIRALGGAEGVS